MPEDDQVVSQFDRNFVQILNQDDVLQQTGVQFYHVIC